MDQSKFKFSLGLLLFAAGVLVLTGCMMAKPKPGDTAKFTYPVKGVNCAPGKIALFVKTMSQ